MLSAGQLPRLYENICRKSHSVYPYPDACPQQSCTPDNNMKKSPNNDVGLDAMLSIVAHEISETATDPLFKSWYDFNGEFGTMVFVQNLMRKVLYTTRPLAEPIF